MKSEDWPQTPKALLLKIYSLDKSKKYGELKKYIYSVKFKNKNGKFIFDSQEKIIDGIKKRVRYSNFSYNPPAILFHIKFVNKYTVLGTPELISKHLEKSGILNSDEKLKKLAQTSPQSFLFYNPKITKLIFVKMDNKLRLLVSINLTDLSDPAKKTKVIPLN